MLRMLAYFFSFFSHTGCSPVDVTGIPGPPDGPPVEVAVSVDYGQRQTISLPWGFLHGVSTTIPPDSLLAPLKPTFWRSGGLARYDRVVALGARFEFVLSDGWQYPSKTFGWPWQNPQEWQAYVQKIAQQNIGRPILWDVWNEPNHPHFWVGSETQLFQTYLQAYQILRTTLGPTAMIGGPSIQAYDAGYLTRFLDFCLANGCEVNFLSWHENGRSQPQMRSDVASARQLFLQNPRYAPLKMTEVQVNEFGASVDFYKPAAFLANLAALELTGVGGAARTCWTESGGTSNCSNNSLDGMLTDGAERRPRGVWWAAEAYSSLGTARAVSTSNDPGVIVLAGTTAAANTLPLLVGYFTIHPAAAGARIHLTLRHLSQVSTLAGATTVHARVLRIPDSGEFAVNALSTLLEVDAPVVGDSAQVELGQVQLNEVLKVALSRNP
jgi:hypothetical protein